MPVAVETSLAGLLRRVRASGSARELVIRRAVLVEVSAADQMLRCTMAVVELPGTGPSPRILDTVVVDYAAVGSVAARWAS